jgi:hypothetical protein
MVRSEPDFAKEAGFNVPVALTTALAALVYPTRLEIEGAGQSTKGRLWDVLNMARLSRPRPMPAEGVTWTFRCIFWLDGSERQVSRVGQHTFTLKAVLGPGDDGEPVVTIMLENED